MKEQLKKIKELKYTPIIILALVLVIQIFNMCHIYVSEKKSVDCDEIYSFGLANSFYEPFIEMDNIYSHEYHNIHEWFPGEEYRNYLTVQEGEQFRYDSVWYNQSQDRHPPLFYAVLHTVSSFFPDTLSFWFGFIPNLIYFTVTQIFLYKLARNILKSKYQALLFCLVWGFSPAAVDITLFIRMYCMLTMWTVILMYLHSKLFYSKEEHLFRQLITISVITALGALTQYLFLFVAFIMAVCFCVRYLLKKQFRLFFAYGLSMLAGVLILFIVFPASIDHLFNEKDNASGGALLTQLVISVRYIFLDIFCIQQSTIVWLAVFLPPFIGILIIMSLPVLFLFRNKLNLKQLPIRIKKRIRSAGEHIRGFKLRSLTKQLTGLDPTMLIMLISVIVVVLIASYTVNYLAGFANRYLFIIYPFAALFVFSLICFIFSFAKHKNVVMTVLSALLIINLFLNGEIVNYWLYDNDLNVNQQFSKSNVVVVLDFNEDFRTVSTMGYEFFNTENVFMTTYSTTSEDMEKIEKCKDDVPLYIMMYTGQTDEDDNGRYLTHMAVIQKNEVDFEKLYVNDYLSNYQTISDENNWEYIGQYEFVQGNYLIYRLNRSSSGNKQ